MKKRGSLALSMNAIVILIMAIAMLGVGLGVIQMVRQKAETSLEEIAAEEAPAPAASSSDPLTISRTTIPAKPGEEFVVKVKYYGITDDCITTECKPYVGCTDTILVKDATDVSSKTVVQYETKEFIAKMKISPDADKGFHICTLKMIVSTDISLTDISGDEQDIVIKVI